MTEKTLPIMAAFLVLFMRFLKFGCHLVVIQRCGNQQTLKFERFNPNMVYSYSTVAGGLGV